MLVSDCCGSTPWSQRYAEINGCGVCTECKEDCLYITQQEYLDKELKLTICQLQQHQTGQHGTQFQQGITSPGVIK